MDGVDGVDGVEGGRRGPRARAVWLVRLLLGYTPPPAPPPEPEGPPRPRWRWLATGGGLGADTVYPYGVALGLALMVWIVWSAFLFAGDAPGEETPDPTPLLPVLVYLAVSGSLAGRRTRSIWAGAAVGGVTAMIGIAIALLTLTVLEANLLFVAAALSAILPAGAFGFVAGAAGAALAQPRQALRAIRDGLRQR